VGLYYGNNEPMTYKYVRYGEPAAIAATLVLCGAVIVVLYARRLVLVGATAVGKYAFRRPTCLFDRYSKRACGPGLSSCSANRPFGHADNFLSSRMNRPESRLADGVRPNRIISKISTRRNGPQSRSSCGLLESLRATVGSSTHSAQL